MTCCSETGPFSIGSLSHLWILSSLLFLIYRARIYLLILYLALRVMDFWHQIELICLPFKSLLEFAASPGFLCHRFHLRKYLPSGVLSGSIHHKRKPPLCLHLPVRVISSDLQRLSVLTPLLPVHSLPLPSLLCCRGLPLLVASPPQPIPVTSNLRLFEPMALPLLALWLVMLLFLCVSVPSFCVSDAFHFYSALCLSGSC